VVSVGEKRKKEKTNKETTNRKGGERNLVDVGGQAWWKGGMTGSRKGLNKKKI